MTQQEYNQLQKQLAQQGHTIKLVNGKVTDSTGKPLFKISGLQKKQKEILYCILMEDEIQIYQGKH